MGTAEDTADAASRLALLHQHFREHPVTGTPARHTPAANPAAPVNLTVVDHIDATVRELADYTRQANPEAGPLPGHVRDVYAWCLANTTTAPADAQRRRDTIVYRQRLEHAVAVGDIKVVRPHRCPACRTFGLMWRRELEAAVCTNGRCLTKDGLSRRWTLARLAYEHVARTSENAVRECAT